MDRPLGEQLDALDEDLIQIEFPNQIIVDVGWYPSHSPKGEFQVVLIKSYDWEKPVRLRKSTDANTLRRDVAETIEEAKRLCVR